MKRIQKITLGIFLIAMLFCVDFVLFMIWSDHQEFDIINRLTFTFFVIGLASFLIWITTIIIEVKNKIEKR